MAMYQSKAQGRSRYSFFHSELNAELRMRLGAEQELARAIANGELLLHYQPIFHAQSLALASCEALVRWQHPQRGLLPPSEFIGLAEASGLIRELGAWTVREACRQIAQWRAQGLQPCKVAVNVSALQFRDQQLFETIQTALRSHRVAASELELELTESTLMADSDTSQRIIERLRELGLALVVDDFGTGFSSLSYLKRLRPDKIKIDRSFVRDLPDDADDRTVAEAILRMAQALGIRVVAEGVETTQQRDFLRAQGCELLQGYLLGRPEAADIVAGRMLRVAA
jgi:EAL domain-containing protein (putative c-di-GMP-specific phosphodiesterase class I)